MNKILLINNAGDENAFRDLHSYLQKHQCPIDVIDGNDPKLANFNDSPYQAIILSGGRRWLNYDEIKPEQDLIKTTQTPIFGICYGAQLIAYCFGANPRFKELPFKRWGWQNIKIVQPDNLLQGVQNRFWAFESHQFIMRDFNDNFTLLAESSDGPEIFKIKNKPIYGVQFHPEWSDNELDPNPRKILDNFLEKLL